MSRLKSWSFWLLVALFFVATAFVVVGFMTGTEWAAYTGGLYGVWSGKDAFLKRNGQ